MRSILLVLFAAVTLSASAQNADSSAVARMYRAGFYLDKFVTQHNTGLAIGMGGGAFALLATAVFPVQPDIYGMDTNQDARSVLIAVGALGGIAGAVITLDSYKFLRRSARQLKK